MLDLMRKHARSWFIKAVLFAVIVVFVLWGVGSFREGKSNIIATVNGYSITIDEYRNTYENLLNRYREIHKNQLSEKLIDRLKLKETALESLIERVLLVQEAERLNLEVTPQELRESIMDHPAFQKDGVFNNSQYVRLLSYHRMTPEEFEDSQRMDLLIKKVEDIIKDNVKISDKELLDVYAIENESVNVEFAGVTISSFLKKARVSDDDIKDYFSKHNVKYEIPEKVNVQYLSFNPKDYESKVKITDEDVSDYYQLNIERFVVPEKIKARHILIKTLPGDDPESVKKAREKAERILGDLRNGGDFAALAKKYSDDPSAKKGGDLGFIETEDLMDPIRDAISSLKAGEVSPVTKSYYGFHIIKAEEIINPRTKSLKEVEPQITSILRREKAQELADEEAEDAYARIFDGENLQEFASNAKIDLHKTGLFAVGESIKEIGKDRAFSDIAFALDKGEISEVVRSSGINYILEVTEKLAPRIPELNEVKERVRKDVQKEKGKAIARAKAEKLLEELRTGKEWKHLASKNKLKVEETGFFTRGVRAIPKIGYSEEIRENVFSLTPDNPYPGEVFEVNDTYVIIRLKSRKGMDKEAFESAKDRFREILMEQKKKEVFAAWLDDLKARAEIEKELSRIR